MRFLRAFRRHGGWFDDRHSGLVINVPGWNVQYFAIPKVACSSVMAALVPAIGVSFPCGEWLPEIFQTNKWDHLFDRDKIVLTKRKALELTNCWRFGFVRNPWDRLVSCYAEKIRPDGDDDNFVGGLSKVLLPFGSFHADMTFEEFALAAVAIDDVDADPHWRSQYTFIIDAHGQLALDFVGRFETLGVDAKLVAARLGGKFELPHLLKSGRGAYQAYYSQTLRDIVADRYRRDIDLFGYDF